MILKYREVKFKSKCYIEIILIKSLQTGKFMHSTITYAACTFNGCQYPCRSCSSVLIYLFEAQPKNRLSDGEQILKHVQKNMYIHFNGAGKPHSPKIRQNGRKFLRQSCRPYTLYCDSCTPRSLLSNVVCTPNNGYYYPCSFTLHFY